MHELLSQALGDDLLGEVVGLTRDLIRVDTTNPPGNETLGVEVLEAYLAATASKPSASSRDPARANLIARVRGRGTGPSLALVGHTDVVYADPADWSSPPFGGEVRDGHLWGRGALDMKGQTAASAVALAVLARSGWVPNGDVLLIAEADEEDGVDEVGMSWLVRERPDLRCDYALTEANYRLVLADGRTIYTLVVGEKMTMPVRVTRARRGRARLGADARGQRAAQARARARAARRPTSRCAAPRPSSTRCWTCLHPATGRWASESSAAARSTRSSGTCCRHSRARRSCRRWPAPRASAT